MPLFDKREFAFAFQHNSIGVLAYVQRNMRTNIWEAEYCNSVTKDTLHLPYPPVSANTKSEAIKHLRLIHAHSKAKR